MLKAIWPDCCGQCIIVGSMSLPDYTCELSSRLEALFSRPHRLQALTDGAFFNDSPQKQGTQSVLCGVAKIQEV
jgi:hypothetical protein